MGSTIISLLFFGLIVGLRAMDDHKLLMSPDSDKDVVYRGLTDAEKESLKKNAMDAGSLLADNKYVEEYEAETQDDNCRCSRDEPSCACEFKMSLVNLNVTYAVGYTPEDQSIAVILAIDGYIIVNDRIKISAKQPYKPPCMPLPPPTFWLAGCFQMKITEDKSQGFTICGTIDLEIRVLDHAKRLSSRDLTCFVHANVKGEDRLEIKDHSVGKGDVAIKNVKLVKGVETSARELNALKRARMMKEGSTDVDAESLDEPSWLWNHGRPFDHKPSGERPVDPKKIGVKKNWRLLGLDEVPYLAILFKGFVAPKLTSAQGISSFEMIKNAIYEATDKIADWHQNVVPNVFEPGLSCGGALLTPNRVLTICACIRSFYYHNKHKKPAPGTGSKYDIKIDGDEHIYLEFSETQFTGKQYHHLDRDPSTFDDKSSCFKLIESGSEGQQAEMVVMPFTPRIASQNPFLYVLWPPYPIHDKYKLSPSSNLVTYGTHSKESLNFTDFGGLVMDPKIRAVSIMFKRDKMTDYCVKETFQNSAIPEPFKIKTTCFQAEDPKYQICKGLVGFPITVGDEIAGLSASPVDCDAKEGSMMGAVFGDQIVKEIETYLGKDLKTRRTAAHTYLYREPGEIVRVIPDYSTSDATPKPKPQPQPQRAAAKRVACSTSLVIFLSITVKCQF